MVSDGVVARIEDGVGIVELDRPAARNALSRVLLAALTGTLQRMDRDPAVRAVLIASSGPHFAAGSDIREMLSMTAAEARTADYSGCCDHLARMAKPVVAAVEGVALGGGCELVEMCDIVIASETARFGHPEVTLGTLSGCGGTQRLPRLAGRHRALDALLTGRTLDAREACEWGLVSRVVAAARLREEALAVARRLASLSAPAVQAIKRSVREGMELPLAGGLQLERRLFHRSLAWPDRTEGMDAFLARRPAAFAHHTGGGHEADWGDLSTAHVADACVRLGVAVRSAPSAVRPVFAGIGMACAGRARPVRHFGSADIFLEAIDAAAPGEVLVVDNEARLDEACVGDLVAQEAKAAGLAGLVVWGLHRDTRDITRIGLPVFSLGALPLGPRRLDPRTPGAQHQAVVGGATVTAQDMVLADDDGVLFVPMEAAGRVRVTAGEIRDAERSQADAIEAGTPLRRQLGFDQYLERRRADPAYTLRRHLQELGGAIEA